MSLCTVLEAMWRIENKKSAVLKPKENSKNIWQNLKNNFLFNFKELKIYFGLEIQHGKKNYTLKWEYQILHMGLSTADSKQVLCHMILFKVLSLGLLWSLWPLCWVSCFIYYYAECHYVECRYAECPHAEWHVFLL